MNDILLEPKRVFSEASSFSVERKEFAVIPQHIAIIMDGNRRWAKQKKVSPLFGHWKGAEKLSRIVECAKKYGIKTLTVYAFSTENWNRPSEEVDALMLLFQIYLLQQKERMIQQGIRFATIGNVDKLPSSLRQVIEEIKAATAQGSQVNLVVALNYGARDDIRRAVCSITEKCVSGKLQLEEVTEDLIASHLDTAPWGDPQLLIRTSGESRLSNFLLWQISYAEVYITQTFWPDFTEEEFVRALEEFQKRDKRRGS